jgi:Flp pilus assembly protein TadG
MSMTGERIHSFVSRRLGYFAADQRGISAVEFALLLPLMITLYLGGVEISQAVSADRKNTLVSHTIGDLVAQYQNIADTDMTNILNAASAVTYPFPVSNLRVTVSSVCIDASGTATIAWSDTLNGTRRSGTVTSSIPGALLVANSSLIWGEASYAYRPTVGWTITGTLTLNNRVFLRPRVSNSVTRNGANGC